MDEKTIADLIQILQEKPADEIVEYIIVQADDTAVAINVATKAPAMKTLLSMF